MPTPIEQEALSTELSLEELERKVARQSRERRQRINDELELMERAENLPPISPPAPEPTEEEPEEDDGLIDNVLEVLLTAAERTAEEILQFAGSAGTAIQDKLDFLPTQLAWGSEEFVPGGVRIPFTSINIDLVTGAEWREMVAEAGGRAATLENVDIPDADRPDSTVGKITADILRFAAGFALTRRAMPISAPTRARSLVASVVQAGAASVIVADPLEENLLNVLEEHWPGVVPDMVKFLESDEEDSQLLNRIRTGIIDSALGLVLEPLILGAAALIRRVRRARGPAEVTEAAEREITDDAVEAAEAAEREGVQLDSEVAPSVSRLEPTPIEPVFDVDTTPGQSFKKINVEQTEARLPPVPEGHVRMYRAESPTVKHGDVFDEEGVNRTIHPDFDPSQMEGKFFTPDLEWADSYRDAYGPDARIFYVDVPKSAIGPEVAPREYVLDLDAIRAGVAQQAEQAISNRQVVGSTPSAGSTSRAAARSADSRAQELTASILERIRAKGAVEEIAEKIRNGAIKEAEELIDFNATTRDWEEIARQAQDTDGRAVMGLINEISKKFDDIIGEAKGGVQARELSEQLAAQVGGSIRTVEELFLRTRGNKGLTAQFLAAAKFLQGSAVHFRRLAKRAAQTGRDEDFLALERHIETHALIQAQIKGSQTEIARALNAMKRIQNLEAEGLLDLEGARNLLAGANRMTRRKMAERIANERSLSRLNRISRQSGVSRAVQAAVEYYVNSLLSSLSTLTLNYIGNGIKVVEATVLKYPAVGIGVARNAVRRAIGLEAVDRVTLREANAFAFGLIKGHEMAWRIPVQEILQNVRERGMTWTEAVRDAEESFGTVWRAIRHERPIIDVVQRADVETYRATEALLEPITGARTARAVGTLVRLPGRGILAADEHIKTVAYWQEVFALSYRQAAKEADEQGLRVGSRRREAFMRRRIDELRQDPPLDMHDRAIDFARYQTFQERLTGLSRDLEILLNRHPVLKFIVPFYRTPVNIVRQSVLERSPFALLRRAENNLLRQIVRGGPEADMAIARVAVASSLLGWGIQQQIAGNLKGSGRAGNLERNTEELSGIPPYSVRVGDRWLQFNRFDPYGMMLGLAADLGEIIANWDATQSEKAYWELAAGATVSIAQNITDKTWFKGVADVVEAIEDPKRYLERYAIGLGTTFVTPYSSLIRRINTDHDEFAREAWSFVDQWKRNIPGLSDELPVRRDLLGNPVEKYDYIGGAWLSPVILEEESKDPLNRELARLAFAYRMPDKDLYGIGEQVTPQQYSRFLEIRGTERMGNSPSLQETLRSLIESPVYKNELSDEGRIKVIQDAITAYGRAARLKLLEEDQELREKVIAKKRDLALGLLSNDDI